MVATLAAAESGTTAPTIEHVEAQIKQAEQAVAQKARQVEAARQAEIARQAQLVRVARTQALERGFFIAKCGQNIHTKILPR